LWADSCQIQEAILQTLFDDLLSVAFICDRLKGDFDVQVWMSIVFVLKSC